MDSAPNIHLLLVRTFSLRDIRLASVANSRHERMITSYHTQILALTTNHSGAIAA